MMSKAQQPLVEHMPKTVRSSKDTQPHPGHTSGNSTSWSLSIETATDNIRSISPSPQSLFQPCVSCTQAVYTTKDDHSVSLMTTVTTHPDTAR